MPDNSSFKKLIITRRPLHVHGCVLGFQSQTAIREILNTPDVMGGRYLQKARLIIHIWILAVRVVMEPSCNLIKTHQGRQNCVDACLPFFRCLVSVSISFTHRHSDSFSLLL